MPQIPPAAQTPHDRFARVFNRLETARNSWLGIAFAAFGVGAFVAMTGDGRAVRAGWILITFAVMVAIIAPVRVVPPSYEAPERP